MPIRLKLVLILFVLAFAEACKKKQTETDRYEAYTISGVVRDCGGLGVGGQVVEIYAYDTSVKMAFFPGMVQKLAGQARADANGKFTFRLEKPGENWKGFYYLLYAFDSATPPDLTYININDCDRKLSADSMALLSLSGHSDYYFTINKANVSVLKLILNDVSPFDSSDHFFMYDTSLHGTSWCAVHFGSYVVVHYDYEFFTPQHNTIVYKHIFANDSNYWGYYVTKNGITTYHNIYCLGAPPGDTSLVYLNY
jgi:hypothetical protein